MAHCARHALKKVKKAATYLATAENITNKLRKKFCLRFVKLDLVLNCLRHRI